MSLSPSNSAELSMSRAAQRKLRLMAIEQEEAQSDLEALKLTEEQRQILFRSFTSVKVEFYDLDGLSWTPSALKKRCRTTASLHNTHSISPSSPAFTVLTQPESKQMTRRVEPIQIVNDTDDLHDDLKTPVVRECPKRNSKR